MPYSESILIVDDDPIFTAVTVGALKAQGINAVVSAENGEDGLHALQHSEKPFGLIILDLNMPKLDGLAFMRSISESEFSGQVLISSGEDGSIIKSAFNMGKMLGVNIVGTVRKPLDLDQLTVVLDRCAEISDTKSTARKLEEISDYSRIMLVPYYQPQLEIKTRSLIGVEALTRIKLDSGNLANPGGFFQKCSRTPEARIFAFSIIRQVLADMRERQHLGISCRVSINLDVYVAEQPGCAEELIEAAAEFGVPPTSITVELTETSLPTEPSRLLESLTRMRIAGFGISIDDYGTGGANFDLLQMGPFTELKIDVSIVRAAEFDPISARFLETTIEFAEKFKLRTIAEGIESESQLDMVREQGVDAVQGYLFGRAVPESLIREQLRSVQNMKLAS